MISGSSVIEHYLHGGGIRDHDPEELCLGAACKGAVIGGVRGKVRLGGLQETERIGRAVNATGAMGC